MKRDLFTEVKVELEEGGFMQLFYYLLTGESKEIDGPVYGVYVVKSKDGEIEEERVEHVTYLKEEAEHMLLVLSKNKITPLCTAEIIDSLLV